MPNDPTLYPGIPNPQQQLLQRIAQLETRVASIERKRDPVFTPISFGVASSATFTWYGGRLWYFFGGGVNGTGAGQVQVGMRLNSVAGFANFITDVYGASTYIALPMAAGVVANPATFNMTAGGTNTFTLAVDSGPGQIPAVAGMLIEWPQS